MNYLQHNFIVFLFVRYVSVFSLYQTIQILFTDELK